MDKVDTYLENTMDENLMINKQSWDLASKRFFGRAALPDYGPYVPSEDKLNLFGDLSGLKVLDIGCGSGHSMKYMYSKQVKEIWGLDLSRKQIETAKQVVGINLDGKLFESPMEENPGIPLDYFDIVYSIYALGWTLDLPKTLNNIYSYLKPGGTFIFSWEHPIHSRLTYCDNSLIFTKPYHDETATLHEAWKPTPAVYHHRKLSTYINVLINSVFFIEKVIDDIELPEESGQGKPEMWYSEYKASYYPATFIIKCRKGK